MRTTKQPRSGSAAAELAAVTLFARHVERHPARLMLFLPEDHELVSASTYRVLAWGGGSHRETIRSYAPELHAHVQAVAAVGESIVHLDGQSLSANRAEWDQLPFVVPTIAPRDGHVYVTHESGEKLSAGGELYHRIYIEEQTRPKEIPLGVFEARLAESKESWTASKAERKLFGETAPLGIKLTTVKTKRNGDCFFDACCKAFANAPVHRGGRRSCGPGHAARGRRSGGRGRRPDGASAERCRAFIRSRARGAAAAP